MDIKKNNSSGRNSKGRFAKGNRLSKQTQFAEGNTIGKATQFTEDHAKTGDCAFGTLNRMTVVIDKLVDDMLAGYLEAIPKEGWNNPTFFEDFGELEPKMRVEIVTRLIIARLSKKANNNLNQESESDRLWLKWLEDVNLPKPTDEDFAIMVP